MNVARASSLAIRSSSRRRKRVSTSVRPWCLSGGGRRLLASTVKSSTRSVSSPRLLLKTVPSIPIRSPRSSSSSRSIALLAEDVDARLELDPARAVDEVEERHLALAAARRQAPGDTVGGVGLGAGLEVRVRGDDFGERRDAREGVRERVDALLAQAVELRAARLQELGQLGLGGLVAHERGIIAQHRAARCQPPSPQAPPDGRSRRAVRARRRSS